MVKIAIVTGGCRGIGLAVSKRLTADGYQVVCCGRSEESTVDSTLKQITQNGLAPVYFRCDVSNSADRKTLVDGTVARFGRIDLLVNNAGVAPRERTDILSMTEESWDYVMDTNAKSNMFMTQLVARVMKDQPILGKKRGTIVNISSCSAEVSSPNRAQYCVSKAGISMLTKIYADALAPFGIFVNEVRPGVIKTDMTNTVTAKYDNLIASGVFPIARWGQPEDVAAAVSVLASDELLYTTGNFIDVDGGFHIKSL